jgi:hypothetical protein
MAQAVEEALQTVARQQQLEILSTLTSEGKQPVPGRMLQNFSSQRDSRGQGFQVQEEELALRGPSSILSVLLSPFLCGSFAGLGYASSCIVVKRSQRASR